ncbi:hypothetical protein A2U01_0114881, partial [Trifolium medium]|nr:hypothetical protein [Trifolium medium]
MAGVSDFGSLGSSTFGLVGSSNSFPFLKMIAFTWPFGFCCGCPGNVPAGAE